MHVVPLHICIREPPKCSLYEVTDFNLLFFSRAAKKAYNYLVHAETVLSFLYCLFVLREKS